MLQNSPAADVRFQCGSVRFSGEPRVEINHRTYSLAETIPGILTKLSQTVPADDPAALELTLEVTNTGSEPIWLDRITLFHTDDLVIGDKPSGDWLFYRQGRHKNDLPAITRLGDRGACFEDAKSSVLENGMGTEDSDSRPLLISDSMTLVTGGPQSTDQLLITFETGARHLVETRLELSKDHSFVSFEAADLPDRLLAPGETCCSEVLRIAAPADELAAIDAFAARKAALYHARKAAHIPSVYCTWYYYGLTVDEKDVYENLQAIKDRHLPFEVYQIDEGWETVLGDWRPNPGFPSGMKKIADDIRAAGMIPGIWTSPFIAGEDTPVAAEHPDWFLKFPDGLPCLFNMNSRVYWVLDITHPDAVAWAADLYRELREMGYMYHKLDFTRAAVIYPGAVRHNPYISPAQAYREAVAALREQMGEDAYFLMCGGLYDPILGLVDAQRTGSDVKSMWSVNIGKNGKTVPFTVKQNLLRYYFRDFWDADPDALMLRRRTEPDKGGVLSLGLLTDREARTSTLNMFLGCGLCCDTEKLIEIEDDRLSLLRHVMPVVPGICHPRDLFTGSRYPGLIDLDYGTYHLVAIINWSDTEDISGDIVPDAALLGNYCTSGESYTVASFFDGVIREHVPAGSRCEMPSIPPHGAALYKVCRDTDAPVVLTSTGHFAFGAELADLSVCDDKLHFELQYDFSYPIRYGIRLPQGYHPASLPAGMVMNRDLLEVQIPGAGHYDITVPLAKDPV
ncbi:MAG: alpha-galactosidase [Firmicutes bacterium]|nr:alpha-galactosidase [Bacillota bacterium]